MRKRDEVFVNATMRELSAGVPLDEAKVTGLREAQQLSCAANGVPWSDEAVARKADVKLRSRIIREAMAEYLEVETGMRPGEMLQIRVAIARGEGIDPRTTPIQLRALEGLEKLTFVPPTQRMEIDSRSTLSAVVMADMSGGVPSMDATPVDVTPRSGALEPVTLDAEEDEDDE